MRSRELASRALPLVLAAVLPLATSVQGRQAVPTVMNAAAPVATTTPLETFDAAWQLLRENYVAETAARVDWERLRTELRPRAAKATSAEEVRGLIREMLSQVGQSHFAVLPAPVASALSAPAVRPDEAGSLGFDVRLVGPDLVVTRVDENGPARRAGVQAGWTLARIAGSSVPAALAAVDSAPAHVRAFQAWAMATTMLRGRSGERLDLGFLDASNRETAVTIVRAPERGQPVKLGHLPTLFARLQDRRVTRGNRSVGIIEFNVWMTPVVRQFDEAMDRLRTSDGIVIDLRGNPGGVLTMIMGISGHFVREELHLGIIKTRESELKLVANPRLVGTAGQPVKPYDGPVAILVDSGSYSASEIFTGGMQAIGRARVFGTRTAGGALPAVLERLPGGDVLQYAIGDFVTATGQRIEGRGVVPDEVVEPARADLLASRDRVLDAAIDWIAKGPSTP